MYYLLAAVFLVTLVTGIILLLLLFACGHRKNWWRRMAFAYAAWLLLYVAFIILGTGPTGQRAMAKSSSPYKLPWGQGKTFFVGQGNRSFTSHRGRHLHAWDFWMPLGTKITAARAGVVLRVEQDFDGIGLKSNFLHVQHDDRTIAVYAHIKKHGALVAPGDNVVQGQEIALSGMVGQTLNPHLHFVVQTEDKKNSIPITFADVEDGVPLAGHYYTSGNSGP